MSSTRQQTPANASTRGNHLALPAHGLDARIEHLVVASITHALEHLARIPLGRGEGGTEAIALNIRARERVRPVRAHDGQVRATPRAEVVLLAELHGSTNGHESRDHVLFWARENDLFGGGFGPPRHLSPFS